VLQSVIEGELVGREEQHPRHGRCEVTARLLNELHVQECALVTQVGQVVLGRPSPSTAPA
jgi:hypothetical protein